MPMSREQFAAAVYEECLEEAGFLYEQRKDLLAEQSPNRGELRRQERRLEAFVEALVAGEEAAVRQCLEQVPKGDPGDWYATSRLLSRLGRQQSLAQLLGGVKQSAQEHLLALQEGLCHEMPRGTLPTEEQLPAGTPEEAARVLAVALGFRRQGGGDWLMARLRQALSSSTRRGASAYAWALGRLRLSEATPLLWRCVESEEQSLRQAAAFALLRLGDRRISTTLLAPHSFPGWACLPVGVSGDSAAVSRLKALAAREEEATEPLLALGLLGEPSAVPELIASLEHPARAGAAAEALELITGAGLLEPIEQPEDPPDPDELFEDEQVADYQTPAASENTQLRRLSRQSVEWKHWWEQYRSRFVEGRSYRCGQQGSSARLIEVLGSGAGTNLLRQLLADELVIRYGVDVGFEPEMLLDAQDRALQRGRARD